MELLNEENEQLQQRLRAASNRAAQLELQLETATRPDPAASPNRAAGGTGQEVLYVEVLDTDDYFLPESARLSSVGVKKLAPIVRELKERFPSQPIRVEGYTDDAVLSDKVKNEFPSNWELSAARAAMVVRHLQWTHQMDPARFTVVGRAHYHPLADLSSGEGKRLNRVIRIVVLAE